MAQLVEMFGEDRLPRVPGVPAILWGDLPQQLNHLLLTSTSVAELYSRLQEFLLMTVRVDGLGFGSLDDAQHFCFHFSAGEGVAEFLGNEPIRIDDNPDSPLARAWRTGVPQFAADWANPQDSVPGAYWRERGLRFGWRSSCAIPITGKSGARDILILYSKRPNFLSRDDSQQFVLQLHGLLGLALERLRLLEAMHDSQQALMLYKSAMNVSTHGILIAAAEKDLPICYVNPAFERITGYTAAEAIGRNCRFLQGTDTAQPQMEIIRESLSQGQSCTVELRNYRKNGTMFWNSVSIAPVLDVSGRTTHFIGVQQDITDVKTLLRESIHSNALYRALMGTAELVVAAQTESQLLTGLCRLLVDSELFSQAWIGRPSATDNQNIECLCNPGSQLDGAETAASELAGDQIHDLIVRAWKLNQLQFINQLQAGLNSAANMSQDHARSASSAAIVPLYRGNEIWALLTLQSSEPDIFTAELVELTQRIGRLAGHGLDALDLRETLEKERTYQSWLARHDPLTNLLNRRGLTERADEAIARSQQSNLSMAVVSMSLNGFQALNELHGRQVCDRLLRSVANRLQACMKESDSAGRLDGDDLVLILEALDGPDPSATLAHIQESVDGPIDLCNGNTITLHTSLGVTLFPHDNSTAQHLLRHADQALCTFKQSRGSATSRWSIYQPEVDAQRQIRKKHILSLFHSGQVAVHYQPLVNLQTGLVHGIEALARLVEPTGKLLLPGEFLDCLGPQELTELTLQVLDHSLRDVRHLDRSGQCLNLGINLEPATLADLNAMQSLRLQIETSDISTGRIVLELLEHPDTLSMTGSREVLLDLKRSGARVALDDIGSAYSSLLRIKELPIDAIKLDRSFLNGLELDPKQLLFLMHLGDLSQTLGVELIAEGIETAACRDAITALGIRLAQGYAIAKPMSICDLELWLQEYVAEPWTGPTSPLGAVALQLRELFIVERILKQKPSLLQQTSGFGAEYECPIGDAYRALGSDGFRLLAAHAEWHRTLADMWDRSNGSIDSDAYQTARAAYEAELFRLVLKAQEEQEAAIDVSAPNCVD